MRRQWTNGRHGFRTGSAPKSFSPRDIAGLHSWWRADLGITLNGSTVSAWANQNPSNVSFIQPTAGNQPSYTSSVAALDNKPAVGLFDGTDDYMTAGVAADWAFMHSGAGVTLLFVGTTGAAAGFRRYLDTNGGSTTARGFSLALGATLPGAVNMSMGNGATSVMSFNSTGTIAASSPFAVLFRHNTSLTPDYSFTLNGTTQTGNNVNAPSALDPTYALNLGRRGSTLHHHNGYVAEIAIWNTSVADSDLTRIGSYVSSRYF